MAPVESRDAQMSKPVTKGETMVICVGAQGRDEGTRTHGCCPASPPHTLVEDQGRGIDDDPCVQRLRGWGGGWGSELRPMPTGGLGGGGRGVLVLPQRSVRALEKHLALHSKQPSCGAVFALEPWKKHVHENKGALRG